MKLLLFTLLTATLFMPRTALGQETGPVDIGTGSGYEWQPDGHRLSFVRENTLMLHDFEQGRSMPLVKAPKPLGVFRWISGKDLVFVFTRWLKQDNESRGTVEVFYFSLVTDSLSVKRDSIRTITYESGWFPRLRIGWNGVVALESQDGMEVLSHPSRVRHDRQVFRAISGYPPIMGVPRPLYVDTDVWLIDIQGKPLRRVTTGKKYILPTLSPNGELVTVNDTETGHLLIIDTTGREVADLGTGDDETWAADSDDVFFLRPTDDGHRMLTGDLYQFSLSGNHTKRLTDSPNVHESYPRPSPDGKWLAYGVKPNKIILLPLEGTN